MIYAFNSSGFTVVRVKAVKKINNNSLSVRPASVYLINGALTNEHLLALRRQLCVCILSVCWQQLVRFCRQQ